MSEVDWYQTLIDAHRFPNEKLSNPIQLKISNQGILSNILYENKLINISPFVLWRLRRIVATVSIVSRKSWSLPRSRTAEPSFSAIPCPRVAMSSFAARSTPATPLACCWGFTPVPATTSSMLLSWSAKSQSHLIRNLLFSKIHAISIL